MSRKRSQATDEAGETLNLLVLRSCSGAKDEITISPHCSLANLKATLATNQKLGTIPAKYQRLFYLGRELKTRGRSLEALGVGQQYGVCVIHLHSTVPVHQLPRNEGQQQPQKDQVVELLDDDSPSSPANAKPPAKAKVPSVVDLAGEDSDDDDCIVVEQAPKRHRR